PPALHLDARRIHDRVLDPAAGQVPVQPEAVRPRLVAAPYRGGGLQAVPFLGVRDLPGQPREITRRHRPALAAWLQARSRTRASTPPSPARRQRTGTVRRVRYTRRCGSLWSLRAPPPRLGEQG